MTGAVLYFVCNQLRYTDHYLIPALLAAGAVFFKELVSALIVYMLGYSFSLPFMTARYILPEALVTALFMPLIHLAFRRI
jgi:cell shape-determining protein MreD